MVAAIYSIFVMQGLILIVVLALVLERMAIKILEGYRKGRITKFEPHILNLLIEPSATGPLEHGHLPGDKRYIKEVLLEQANQLKGVDKEQMTSVFVHLGYVPLEIKALRSWRWWRRLEAVVNLGTMQSQLAVSPLIKAVRDPVEDVRLAAVRALGELNNSQGLRVLLDALEDSEKWDGDRILEILASMGSEIRSEIVPRILSSRNPRSRRMYAQLCGLLRLPESVESLTQLVEESDPSTRAMVVEAFGRIGDWAVVGKVIELLGDDEPEARAGAARALGFLDDISSLENLREALSDTNWRVRHNAAESLFRLGGPGEDALEYASTSGNGPTQLVASQILATRRMLGSQSPN